MFKLKLARVQTLRYDQIDDISLVRSLKRTNLYIAQVGG